jgi:cobalt-zinc-cadmium efflux system membrane fusion protein
MRFRIPSLFRSVLGLLPSLAVLVILAGLAVAGHLTGWKLNNLPQLWKPAGDSGEASTSKESADPKEASEEKGLHFASQEALDKCGIKTAPVTQQPLKQYVAANGTIDYSRTRLAHLSTRASGHVWKVYKRAGEPVRKGEILGLIDASDVGRAKADYLQAYRALELKVENQESLKQVATNAAVPERQLREGAAAVSEARIRLYTAQQALVNLGLPVHAEQLAGLSDEQLARRVQFLGLPETLAATLDPATTTANLVPLAAPFDGVVIRSELAEGEVVNSTQPQFIIADVRRVWVTLDVRQEDASLVHKGQRATFTPDGSPGVEAAGEVAWVSTEVDDKTRTVRVRAEVDNPEGKNGRRPLLARSFGAGMILVGEKPSTVTVPTKALQWTWPGKHQPQAKENTATAPAEGLQRTGATPLLFVLQADGLSFEPRTVRVGLQNGEFTEILDGARLGEHVATTGSHVLRSELFKSEIGHAGD